VGELARGQGILVSRMILDRRVGVAVEVCGNAGKLRVQ
jgi:hypothetical protein